MTSYVVDFFVPKSKLCIEINGMNHFYPYTKKFSQLTNIKHKVLLKENFNILHLNSWYLEGLKNDKENLIDLLSKTIATYEKKVSDS